MRVWNPQPALPLPWRISTLSEMCLGVETGVEDTFTSGVWPNTNRAIYLPLALPSSALVLALFIANGLTVSGNVDLGIYDFTLARLVSTGSTAQAGADALQRIALTTPLFLRGPALYYLAAAMDNTTGTVYRENNDGDQYRAIGINVQATAFPLPATAVFAATGAYLPVIGMEIAP